VGNTFRAPTDADLIRRLRARDEGAVADLATVYRGRIQQLALRWLKNPEDAEEIAQDVLFKAVDKIDEFRGDSALSSWLYRITFNAAMSRLRHLRVVRGPETAPPGPQGEAPDTEHAAEVADAGHLADEVVLHGQLRQRLAGAVRRLPAIYRAPVILRDLRGLTTEEASSLLRLNDQTLKSRLHRGRQLLRRELADFADGLGLHAPRTTVYG
jgi:RNA polymerase sigma-70 factor (ECF subfamily)